MQEITRTLKSIQPFGFFIGVAFGAFVGLMLFSYLVPSGDDMIALYHHKIAEVESAKNDAKMLALTTATSSPTATVHGATPVGAAMVSITSEKQYLKAMVAHHEDAITMSKQLLTLRNVHPEVVSLAKNIISTQTTEIKMMKDWMAAWKY